MGFIILVVILFLPAWTFNYWQAWVYLAIFSLSGIIITIYFLRYNPNLVERRLKAGPAAEKEKSQKIIQSFSSLFVTILIILSILDHRFHWSYAPYYLTIIADVIILIGFLLLFFVFKENTYSSAIIEVENQQKVISTGPYKNITSSYVYRIIVDLYFYSTCTWLIMGFKCQLPCDCHSNLETD